MRGRRSKDSPVVEPPVDEPTVAVAEDPPTEVITTPGPSPPPEPPPVVEKVGEMTLTPEINGMVLVTLRLGRKMTEVLVKADSVEKEVGKLGLGRPTPQTPVTGDRVTS